MLRCALLALTAVLAVNADQGLHPEHLELLERAQKEYATDGKFSRFTIREIGDALHEAPKQVDLLATRGRAMAMEEAPAIKELAVKDLKKALKIGTKRKRTDMEPVLQGLVKTLIELDRFKEAHDTYMQYTHPLPVESHQMMCMRFAHDAGEEGAELAKLHGKKAIELADQDPLSHLVHAFALVAGKPAPEDVMMMAVQAEEALTTAFSLQKEHGTKLPKNWEASARHLLGSLIFKQGPAEENSRLQEALEYFEDAAALVTEKDNKDEHKMYQRSIAQCKKAKMQRKAHKESKKKDETKDEV